jgi:hypothetical protein
MSGPAPTARVADGISPIARTGCSVPSAVRAYSSTPSVCGATALIRPASRGEASSCRCTNRALVMETNSPPTPPVFITSRSSPSGSTVMVPPPTSFSSRDCVTIASPMASSVIITPTPSPNPPSRKSDRHGRSSRPRTRG